MRKLLITLTFTLSSCGAYACPSQIITLPDGRTIVCFYCNDGRIVNCEKL